MSTAAVGEKVPAKVIRSGKEMILDVLIGTRPDQEQETQEVKEKQPKEIVGFRGLAVEDLTPENLNQFRLKDSQGVVVVDIEEDSIAQRSNFEVGDVIIKIESSKINNISDFIEATSKIKQTCLVKTTGGYLVLKNE